METVHEFYRLKALITLEPVNTTECSQKIRIRIIIIKKKKNTRTKSIQKQIKSIEVDKLGGKKPLASKSCSCRINHLLIPRSNLQASETDNWQHVTRFICMTIQEHTQNS